MDIKTLKLDLVERIIQTENSSVLIKIKKLFQPEKSEDWWDELPIEVQESIFEGLNDVKEGIIFIYNRFPYFFVFF